MKRFKTTAILLMLLSCLAATAGANVKVRTLVSILGEEVIHVEGIGIVTGLNGTGDKSQGAVKSLQVYLEKNNMALSVADLESKNVALVRVDAEIPPFIRPGQIVDVRVTALNDASSLEGGVLLNTMLSPMPGGEIYARASGRINVGGGTKDSVHATSGRISASSEGGAQILIAIATEVVENDNQVRLNLNRRSFPDAASIARRINTDEGTNPYLSVQLGFSEEEGRKVAWALDAGQVLVEIPPAMRNKKVEYISELLDLDVAVSRPARVLINRQTGTVVITGEVRVDPVVISHRSLTVTVAAEQSRGEVTGRDVYRLDNNQPRSVVELEGHDTTQNLRNLINTLNAMGVTSRDLIVILEKLKGVGVLHAELIME